MISVIISSKTIQCSHINGLQIITLQGEIIIVFCVCHNTDSVVYPSHHFEIYLAEGSSVYNVHMSLQLRHQASSSP